MAVNLAEVRYVYAGSGLVLRGTSANSLQLKRGGLVPVEYFVIGLFGKY